MSSLVFHFKLFCRRVKRLRELKKTGQYDACISFMDSANVANILSGNRYTKVIASVHTSIRKAAGELPQYKYIISPLIRLLYNKADAIVAVSIGVRKELIENFGLLDHKVVTIENGCNVSELKQQANEPWDLEDDVLKGRKLIVTAGRLSEAKGQWHLIRAFREVCRRNDDAILLILGAGPLENYLKQLVKQCGIQDRVLFKGFVRNPYKYISKADVFVMSSIFEGYPYAMAEAVCLGVPCIATDFHTGAREILAPELVNSVEKIREVYLAQYGILTPVCSGNEYEGKEELESAEAKMADAIITLLEDEEKKKYYAERSMERSADLKIESVIDKWIDVIEEL